MNTVLRKQFNDLKLAFRFTDTHFRMILIVVRICTHTHVHARTYNCTIQAIPSFQMFAQSSYADHASFGCKHWIDFWFCFTKCKEQKQNQSIEFKWICIHIFAIYAYSFTFAFESKAVKWNLVLFADYWFFSFAYLTVYPSVIYTGIWSNSKR